MYVIIYNDKRYGPFDTYKDAIDKALIFVESSGWTLEQPNHA